MFVALSVGVPAASARSDSRDVPSAPSGATKLEAAARKQEARIVADLRRDIIGRRQATWRHQDWLEIARSRTSYRERTVIGVAYLRWIRHLWAERADHLWHLRLSLTSSEGAIRYVFGRYADQALRVSWCESRLQTTASNGQYLGIFQMGSSERAKYGHGSSALAQARAAYRYFVASGRDWSPWSCRWAA